MAAEKNQAMITQPEISRSWKVVFHLLMVSPALLVQRILNNDIWFLLASGRSVLAHGIPTTEPLSMHEGLEFVMQQWLSAVIFQKAYANWGETGLFTVVSVMYALTILAIFRLTLRVSGNSFFFSYLVTTASALWAYLFMTTRPYVFSTFVFVIEIYLVETVQRTGKKRLLLILPLLSVLLVNLHAALWPLFLILLLPYLAESMVLTIKQKLWQTRTFDLTLLLAILFSIACALINQYGWKALTYLFRSYGYSEISKTIIEMQPLNINEATGKIYFLAIALVFLVLGFQGLKTVRLRYLFLLSGLAYLCVSSLRNGLLFSVLGFFPLAESLASHQSRLETPLVTSSKTNVKPVISRKLLRGTIVVLIILLLVLSLLQLNDKEISEVPEYTHLFAVLEQVKVDTEIRTLVLYTGYNNGGHAEFIGLKPYLDPRAEVFVLANNGRKDYMAEYIQLQSGKIHYRDFIDRYQFTDLVLGPEDILRVYLPRDPDFELVFISGEYVWYRRVLTPPPSGPVPAG